MLNNNPYKVGFGILLLLGLIYIIASFIKKQILFNKTMDELEKHHPKYKEKIRVYKTRKGYVQEKVFDKTKLIYYIPILIMIIILYYTLNNDLEHIIKPEYMPAIIMGLVLGIIILISLSLNARTTDAKKYIEKELQNNYGHIIKNSPPPTQIIHKDKSELGNIREKGIFSYTISKYNCTLENYYYEELKFKHNASNSHYYKYIKFKNALKYCYNLEKLGIQKNIEYILSNTNIVKIINELSEIKFINVSINNKYLIIEKETVLHGYNENDAHQDAVDIELLYNTLVKKILEEFSYEMPTTK